MGGHKKVVAVVALIEDEAILRETFRIIMDAEGFEVLTASSGQEGLELVKHNKPDFILLDILMPDLNGLDFLRAYKAKEHPETKVIVFSNLSDPEEIKTSKELGAWQYLVKADFTPRELADRLKKELAAAKSK